MDLGVSKFQYKICLYKLIGSLLSPIKLPHEIGPLKTASNEVLPPLSSSERRYLNKNIYVNVHEDSVPKSTLNTWKDRLSSLKCPTITPDIITTVKGLKAELK